MRKALSILFLPALALCIYLSLPPAEDATAREAYRHGPGFYTLAAVVLPKKKVEY